MSRMESEAIPDAVSSEYYSNYGDRGGTSRLTMYNEYQYEDVKFAQLTKGYRALSL